MPGGLFDEPYINMLSFTPKVGVSFIYFFILTAALKYWNRFQKIKFHYKEFNLVFLYFIFLFFVSFIYGYSARSILQYIYAIISLLFFIEIPIIINNRFILLRVIKLLFFSTILLFAFQLFDIIFSVKIIQLCIPSLSSDQLGASISIRNDEKIIRSIWCGWIAFFSLTISLYHLIKYKNRYFSYSYLYIVASVSFLHIFLSGTRGYIIQFIFILSIFFLLKSTKSVKIIALLCLFLILFVKTFTPFQQQLNFVNNRMQTLISLYEGDQTAEGTLIRLTERAPRVWNKYIESPVLGFGFSDEGCEYNDGHVGNYVLLLQGGVVGFAIFFYTLLWFISRLLIQFFKNRNQQEIIILVSSIVSLVIAHSTSSVVFNYYFEPSITSLFSFLIVFIKIEVFHNN